MPENTGKIQESTRFKKGQSGNPNGRPKGARNKAALVIEELLEGSLEKIYKKVEQEALNGNMQAAKMILDRCLPVRKDRLISMDLPTINSYENILSAISCIVDAISNGIISPSEGESLSRTLDMYSKALENHYLESKLARIELLINSKKHHEIIE